MAKSTPPRDDNEIRRKGSRTATSLFGLIMLGMIVVGLGGYGVTNFGHKVDSVITVGEVDVSTDEYARALRLQLNSFSKQFGQQFTLKEAQMFGLDQQVLQNLVSNAALSNEAIRIGVSSGNQTLAAEIAKNKAFKGPDGKFDKVTYQRVLQDNNLTVPDFEKGMRDDLTRQVLQAAIVGGTGAPDALVRTLYAYATESRSFTVLQLTEASLPEKLAAPSDDQLQAWYKDHAADFTRPEGKKVNYALLRPADLAKDQTVSEDDIKAAYAADSAQYNIPEKRLVERLVFPSDDEAKAAKAKLDAGTSFEDLVKARGLALTDIDMGDVAKADLGTAGDGVFALAAPGVTGPLPTDLGPALFRVNAILPAQTTTLDQAHDKIKADLALKAAAKAVSDKTEAVNDLLAGGSSIEDVAKAQGMTAGSTVYAPGADDNDPVTADAGFAKAIGGMEPGDYAQAIGLSDGTLMVLQVAEAVPAAPIPFDKAADKVKAAVHADMLAKALSALADKDLAAVQGGARLETLGATDAVVSALRNGHPDGIPPEALTKAFTLKPNETAKVEGKVVALVRLDAVTPSDLTSAAAVAGMKQLAGQVGSSAANDAYDLISQSLANQGGLKIDQTVIAAVQARM